MLTDQQVREALVRYTENPVPSTVFASWLQLKKDAGLAILKGESWKHIERPHNFCYRPMRSYQCSARKLSAVQVEDGLRLYVENNWSAMDLARHFKISPPTAYAILRGRYYKNVARPEGACIRYKQEHLRARVSDLLQKAVDHDWNARQLSEYAGCSLSAAYNLLRGHTYTDIPTPVKSKVS